MRRALVDWADAITIVHVTDGAPPDDSDARAAGCATAARVRRAAPP